MATFFFKMIPPRPDFQQTMTPPEREIMTRHVAYWTERQKEGKIPVFGPVLDPRGAYGIGVVVVDSEEQARALRAADPAVTSGLHQEEIYPMHAVIEGRPHGG